MNDDTISRKAVMESLTREYNRRFKEGGLKLAWIEKAVNETPAAQSEERPIDYRDCSNAMLKMWMDNVVTDGEYNRIMDKLNAHWGKKADAALDAADIPTLMPGA